MIRSRIDPTVKQQANVILHDMGLTMSDAIRLFLHQVITEQRIPFDIKKPNTTTLAAMQAAETGNVEETTLDKLAKEWKS
jgi:DNA-damage-inducible protein J